MFENILSEKICEMISDCYFCKEVASFQMKKENTEFFVQCETCNKTLPIAQESAQVLIPMCKQLPDSKTQLFLYDRFVNELKNNIAIIKQNNIKPKIFIGDIVSMLEKEGYPEIVVNFIANVFSKEIKKGSFNYLFI